MGKYTQAANDPKLGMSAQEIQQALDKAEEMLGEDLVIKARVGWGGRIIEMTFSQEARP